MGHRLSKIYTRTGDNGTTGLSDGSRIEKNSTRIRCLGSLDETNSCVGLIRTNIIPPKIDQMLSQIQHQLLDLGGELSMPDKTLIQKNYVELLETWLDELNENLDPLKEFILPGGCIASAQCHIARTVCRRAEIELVTLSQEQSVNEHCVQYVNRLSDFLFVCARALNKEAGHNDILWTGLKEQNN